MAKPRKPAASHDDAIVAPDSLRREMEDLGLAPYEARMVLALLAAGSASTPQLASSSGIPRTSAYQVLQSLATKGLVERLPGDWPAMWASLGRDEVLDRLVTAQEERLEAYRDRTERVRELLAEMPEVSPVAMPHLQMLRGPAHVRRSYDQVLANAKNDLELFSSSALADAPGAPSPALLQALERGVRVRVLYQESEWTDPRNEEFRSEMAAYHAAGMEARLTPELKIKLAVADRRWTLVGMGEHETPEEGFPTYFLVDHEGYAAVQADAFEQRWATATPLADPLQRL